MAKTTFQMSFGEITVDPSKMTVKEQCQFVSDMLNMGSREQRIETLKTMERNGHLDTFLKSTGSTFEEQLNKVGMFEEQPIAQPNINEGRVAQFAAMADGMSDANLKSMLKDLGMLQHRKNTYEE